MAKRKKKNSAAEDYLSQQQWEAGNSHNRFTPWDRNGPVWKFNIFQKYQVHPLISLFSILIILAAIGLGLITLYQKYQTGSTDALASLVIFVFLLIVISAALFERKRKS
ncbi:MAG TPA: hypothetical protein VJ785_07755 [Anaerolineales bacterium]|nr:hypothetical protein [Anaerolineales bacterium]